MIARCLQENLSKGLSIVGRAVAAKSTLPAITNVLIETEDSRPGQALKLAATNLEIAITCWIPATIEEAGAITVPARLVTEFVNSLPNDNVEMRLNERTRTLNLKCARYEANLKGIDADEFPPLSGIDDDPASEIDPAALEEGISQVVFAAASDDTRPVLAGVLAVFDGDTLTLAAADGFRLAVRRVALAKPVESRFEVIVPARALHELARIASGEEDPVQVAITPNRSQAVFRMKNVQLVSRLIEGTFPNYNQIIPQRYACRTVIGTQDFLKATRIATFFARDASNIVKVQIVPGEELTPGRITVAAASAEVGDAVTAIDAVVEGDNAQIAFNGKYLADVLGALSSAQVALEVTSPSSPGVIKPVGTDNYIHVIMPMHTSR